MFDGPPPIPAESYTPVTVECIELAANSFQLHPDILLAVLYVEGGSVGKDSCSENENGTCDIGPAQINEIHLQELEKAGITRELVQNDGCVNVLTMGWRIAEAIKDQPVNTEEDYLRAIARYHSKSEEFNEVYRERLRNAFHQLYSNDTE